MKRILILDDNLTVCLMLKSWLVKKDYKVDIATSVDGAIETVKNKIPVNIEESTSLLE